MDPFRAYAKHVNPALGRFLELTGRGTRFVRAEGASIEDEDGTAYDDFLAGFGSLNLGHNPPRIKAAIVEHLRGDAPSIFHECLNPFAGALAEKLVAATNGAFETAFLCNSGAEAVECALKTAIAVTGKSKIAYAEGGYHGTTLGALACMAKGLYREPFEAVLNKHIEIPFGDLEALEQALAKRDIAAFLLEPLQMEGGARLASPDYLRSASELCRANGALLLLDEVQTGIGRTGALFAYERLGTVPDMLMIAKSLGAGIVPIGATLMRKDLWEAAFGSYLRSEIHNSTLGGNALACRTAEAVLDEILAPGFLESVRARGDALFAALKQAIGKSPMVRRISHLGMLGGIALADVAHPWLTWEGMGLSELSGYPSSGPLVVERLFRRRILAQVCGHAWSVVRVEPPLIVSDEACARFVDAFADAIQWLEENAGEER
ncbi:MAG: aspartate aminotransferase family protein [Polyangiaceae bacterium]|nr:aspartate aminotransferase family protein [Polyangiaceae bacterium]